MIPNVLDLFPDPGLEPAPQVELILIEIFHVLALIFNDKKGGNSNLRQKYCHLEPIPPVEHIPKNGSDSRKAENLIPKPEPES